MRGKFLFWSIGFFIFMNSLWSQDDKRESLATKNSQVICLVNDSIISNEKILEYYKDEIEGISVIHGELTKDSSHYNLYKQGRGIFFAELNTTIPSKSQEQLNTFFGLRANSPVYVNGRVLDNSKYYIAMESISSITIIDSNKLKNKTLHILLSSKKLQK